MFIKLISCLEYSVEKYFNLFPNETYFFFRGSGLFNSCWLLCKGLDNIYFNHIIL